MRVYKTFYPFAICLAAAVLLLSCDNPTGSNGDDDGDGDDGGSVEEPQYSEDLSFRTTVEVSTYQEFADALDEAENEDVGDWASDEAFLINVVDDIDSGFAENGQLSYRGDVNLYILGVGSERPTIDANGNSRILSGDSIPDIFVEHVRLTGGNGEGDAGGAVYVHGAGGSLNVYNSVFTDSEASSGGAIRGAAGSVEIVDSAFSGNSATGGSFSGLGGAVHIEDYSAVDYWTTSSIEGSSFENNTAAEMGGAVNIESEEGVDVSGSEFSGNSADSGGGALRTTEGGSIETSEFRNNSADRFGGAVHYGHHPADGDQERIMSLTVSGVDFMGNEAGGGDAGFDFGVAIHGDDRGADGNTEIDISDSLFEDNEAVNTGNSDDGYGAVYTIAAEHDDAPDENVTTSGTTYRNNTSTNNGEVLGTAGGELIDGGGNDFEGNPEPSWGTQ